MDSLDQLLKSLLFDGRIVLRGRPHAATSPERTVEVLRKAYGVYRLEVAGPPIPFDEPAALEAGELVVQACWALVNREEGLPGLERRLTMSRGPATPAQHLSADLVFRYLPQIYRRARAIDRNDVLPALLERVLRQWPLSGVLCDLEDGPGAPPDLGDHEGLMLLYAERWAEHENPSWRPAGRAGEFVALVLDDRARERPASPATGMNRHG
jgi:hypothetical protein